MGEGEREEGEKGSSTVIVMHAACVLGIIFQQARNKIP